MNPIFESFFMGGFECSNHLLRSGKRLDLIASTRHDVHAASDYRMMMAAGMRTARDGIRWHLIESTAGRYDFSSALPMIRAAREAGIQVVWDLLHFGWPDHVDVFDPSFPEQFRRFARAFAHVLRDEGVEAPMVAPVNEVSFLSFAGGEAGFFNPFAHGRGDEIKLQFVRAAIAACRVMREVNPRTRFVHIDPIIHIVTDPDRPHEREAAERHERAQYDMWDMVSGRNDPGLGGAPDLLDVIGVNYYIHNQWIYPGGHGSMLELSDSRYRPLRDLLSEVWQRYRRPLFIAETGIEDEARPIWLRYVATEARAALAQGVDLQGICLYPIVNHPGWDDDRHCHNGLWDYADDRGHREAYEPLALEIRRQAEMLSDMRPTPALQPNGDLATLNHAGHVIAEATDRSRIGDEL